MKSGKESLDVDALSLQYRRLEYLSRSPLEAIRRCGSQIQDFADWPFRGKYRVAQHYFMQVYQSNKRGVEYAKEWRVLSRATLFGHRLT